MMNKELIHSESLRLAPKVKEYREWMHQHPELSFEEVNTSKFVQSQLEKATIEFQANVAGHGIVAIIKNPNLDSNSACIAFRSELDALPIQENTNAIYTSKNSGIMHACGHDVHTAILLGVAEILYENKHALSQNVKLIFQIGEEKLPGGASLMIDAGVLENPKVDKIVALHVFPEMEVGNLGVKDGLYMASCDELFLTIYGKGGHGAMPHACIDPIVIGAQIILNLQQIVSRFADPKIPSVLSFGHFEALGATNVIPEKAVLKGTFRTMNEAWRIEALKRIENVIHSTCIQSGAKAEIDIIKGYPFLENNVELTKHVEKRLQSIHGEHRIERLPIRMTSEDFSYFAQKVPACFFRLGVGNLSKEIQFGVHHPKFDVDPACYEVGIASFLSLVL